MHDLAVARNVGERPLERAGSVRAGAGKAKRRAKGTFRSGPGIGLVNVEPLELNQHCDDIGRAAKGGVVERRLPVRIQRRCQLEQCWVARSDARGRVIR